MLSMKVCVWGGVFSLTIGFALDPQIDLCRLDRGRKSMGLTRPGQQMRRRRREARNNIDMVSARHLRALFHLIVINIMIKVTLTSL